MLAYAMMSGRWKWGRWKSNDGTGAQQEMDGIDDRFERTSRGGTGQGRDSNDGLGRVKVAEV